MLKSALKTWLQGAHHLRWRLCLLTLLLPVHTATSAEAPTADEYQIKAAYLYNFATFTEWPEPLSAQVSLCIYGPDPFGSTLDAALAGKDIGGRPVAVIRTNSVESLTDCSMVFVSAGVISNLPRVLDTLRGHSVLTVADSPGAAVAGVMLNMRQQSNRIGFEANLGAARQHRISISFQLLRLAIQVIN
jgi:hypothetical protein